MAKRHGRVEKLTFNQNSQPSIESILIAGSEVVGSDGLI